MSLEVFVGCQASNKSLSNILESTKWLDVLGGKGLFINSSIDSRESIDNISSNSSSYRGISDKFDTFKVLSLMEILSLVNIDDYQVISIDECQFFPDLEVFVKFLLSKNLHVICSGLDSDWLANDFGQVSKLLKLSTRFVKLSAKCLWCKNELNSTNVRLIPDACRTGKLISGSAQIEAGGKDKYVPLCFHHHREHLRTIHNINPDL